MCKSAEQKKDFKVAGFVEFFSYADVNGELNNEGENIRLLNGEFLTYYITYCETNEHTKTMKEKAIMIEEDYKFVLRQVKVIIEDAKAARLEASLKKIQIRDGKRKDIADVRVEIYRKKMKPDENQDVIIQDNPDEDVVPKRGKKKTPNHSLFLEVEKTPKRNRLETC